MADGCFVPCLWNESFPSSLYEIKITIYSEGRQPVSLVYSRIVGLSHTSLDSKQRRTAKSCLIFLNWTGFVKRGPTWADAVNCIDKQSSELEVAFLEPEKKKCIYSELWFKKKNNKNRKEGKKKFRRPMSKMNLWGHFPESVSFSLIPFWKLRSELVKGMNRPHDCPTLWGPECLWIIKEKVIRFCILSWLTVFYCISLYSCFLKISDRRKVYMAIPD